MIPWHIEESTYMKYTKWTVDKNGESQLVLVVEQLSGYTVSSQGYYYKDKQSNEADNHVNDGICLYYG